MPQLNELSVGQTAIIQAISGEPSLVQRLYEFGLLEGELVQMLGFAPMGDPLEILIGNTRLSLRQREAACVAVTPS